MLLWRQKKFLKNLQVPIKKRTKFFAKFMACSCLFHVCAVFLLFFFHTEYRSGMSLNIHSTAQEATVRYFSFRRKKVSQSTESSAQIISKKVKTQVAKAGVKKKIVKKERPVQKETLKSEVKKSVPKKSEKKEIVSINSEEKKQQVDHREFTMLQLQEKIQEAVEGVWCAPPGCSQATECAVKIIVGWDGTVLHTEVQKSSGILLYDITVEHAIPKIEFPHAARGKTLTLAFKP